MCLTCACDTKWRPPGDTSILQTWNVIFRGEIARASPRDRGFRLRLARRQVLNALSAQKVARIAWSFARLEVNHPTLMEVPPCFLSPPLRTALLALSVNGRDHTSF